MKSVVQPMLLSHGTLMCRNLADSRRFYEEFLGLEVVRHAKLVLDTRNATRATAAGAAKVHRL